MGEEIKNNKIYFKAEVDGEFIELGKTEELKVEDNNRVGENLLKNVTYASSLNINLKSSFMSEFRKLLGYNILKPKRFKKLLMSVGFRRNEAEKINKIFMYSYEHRYQYYIDLYAENVKMIRNHLKGV